MSQRPGPAALAKQRGKPHCFFRGGKWHAVTSRGTVGWGETPTAALAKARFRDGMVDFYERVLESRRGPRGKLMFGESRLWLAGDPDAPRPNERIVC